MAGAPRLDQGRGDSSGGLSAADEQRAAWAAEHAKSVRAFGVYLVFMVFFTLLTTRGLTDRSVFLMHEQLENQLTRVEFKPEHAPNVRKCFGDIATVQEFYQWLQGPFVDAAFSVQTFDGDADAAWTSSASGAGGQPAPYLLGGYNRLLGAVRISQLRSKPFDCTGQLHAQLATAAPGQAAPPRFTCYGESSEYSADYGTFTTASEDTAAFGAMPSPPAAAGARRFAYEGGALAPGAVAPQTVAAARAKYLSGFQARSYRAYPAPAYGLTLPPHLNGSAALAAVADGIVAGRFVDVRTRAVFVDLTVYNPTLDRACFVRLLLEMTESGGVVPSAYFEMVRLWEVVTKKDLFYAGLSGVVLLFYLHYARGLWRVYRAQGASRFFSGWLNIAQLLNLVTFVLQLALNRYAESLVPADLAPDGGAYLDLNPVVRFKQYATALGGFNVFLNWFKLVGVLSYIPAFALVSNTLARSARGVSSFLVFFFIIFFGFAQAHTLVFGAQLYAFSTLSSSMFSLMRSLLGDFDFEQLRAERSVMGPLLFVLFVVLAVFVVLNMLIAIITNAYEDAKQEMEVQLARERKHGRAPLTVMSEFMGLVRGLGRRLAKVGALCGCCRGKGGRAGSGGGGCCRAKAIKVGISGDGFSDFGPGGSTTGSRAAAAAALKKPSSPSELLLLEWFEALRRGEDESARLRHELTRLALDVGALKATVGTLVEGTAPAPTKLGGGMSALELKLDALLSAVLGGPKTAKEIAERKAKEAAAAEAEGKDPEAQAAKAEAHADQGLLAEVRLLRAQQTKVEALQTTLARTAAGEAEAAAAARLKAEEDEALREQRREQRRLAGGSSSRHRPRTGAPRSGGRAAMTEDDQALIFGASGGPGGLRPQTAPAPKVAAGASGDSDDADGSGGEGQEGEGAQASRGGSDVWVRESPRATDGAAEGSDGGGGGGGGGRGDDEGADGDDEEVAGAADEAAAAALEPPSPSPSQPSDGAATDGAATPSPRERRVEFAGEEEEEKAGEEGSAAAEAATVGDGDEEPSLLPTKASLKQQQQQQTALLPASKPPAEVMEI